jgi:hypothetical protein
MIILDELVEYASWIRYELLKIPFFRVLSIFQELNLLNSEKALLDLAATTHIKQAACLQFYGQR